MYIEPFWRGVITTILFELGCSIVMTILLTRKEDEDNEEK